MLKTSFTQFFFFVSLLTTMSGHGWEFEQNVTIDGVLRRAERTHITKLPDGKEETEVERSIVLVTDKPLVLCHSIKMGNQQITSTETSYPYIEVCLSKEFFPLIGKHVECHGNFRRTFDASRDEISLAVDTALDYEQPLSQLKTVFYEPEKVEVSGFLYETVYPGPPEYMSVEMGDRPEEATIITLKEPINVEIKNRDEDDFNEPEKGVRELQVSFSDSGPTPAQMKQEIVLKGTLYHAHTAHHRRRVLMMVESWKIN